MGDAPRGVGPVHAGWSPGHPSQSRRETPSRNSNADGVRGGEESRVRVRRAGSVGRGIERRGGSRTRANDARARVRFFFPDAPRVSVLRARTRGPRRLGDSRVGRPATDGASRPAGVAIDGTRVGRRRGETPALDGDGYPPVAPEFDGGPRAPRKNRARPRRTLAGFRTRARTARFLPRRAPTPRRRDHFRTRRSRRRRRGRG